MLKNRGMQTKRDKKSQKEIAKQEKEKYREYRINQANGNLYWNTGNLEKAKNYYQKASENAEDIGDKGCEATSYLGLASVASKEFNYEIAQTWYKKALDISETEPTDTILKEKALVGLGIACFNLGHIQEAIEYIRKARKLPAKETEKEGINVENTQQILDDTEETASP